jgi:hypothetical protein
LLSHRSFPRQIFFAKRADTNSGACNLFPATLPKKKTNLM